MNTHTHKTSTGGRRSLATILGAATLALGGCVAPYPTPDPPQVQGRTYTYPATQADPARTGQQRDFRRRQNETLYAANVTSVREVVGQPSGQRCWIEREATQQPSSQTNVPAAIAGAVIGGILGHQIGGGSGRDIATVGGAVAGAALGSQVGRTSGADGYGSQDVQRCEPTAQGRTPTYWDVTYEFRGQWHRVQMTAPPGRTVLVNADGEPRT